MPALISVVIPTLNAARHLPATAEALLAGVTEGLVAELVISDGGSTDDTALIARELGAVWVEGAPGRGAQIARGVAAAQADWLLILHADTQLSEDWTDSAAQHISRHAEDAGWFRLRFLASGLAPRLVERGANLRARFLGLPYGDQGLLISRRTLDQAGGIPALPLMEDVALARRLKGRLRPLGAEARTSADRYMETGWARRVLSNLTTLALYFMGVAPGKLAKRYDK